MRSAAAQRTRKLAHQLLGPVGLEGWQFGLAQCGQPLQQAQVGLDGVSDAGTADLHHHLAPAVQPRTVHLGDRRSRQRRGVEPGKYFFGFGAQVFAQLRTQGVQRHCGHMAVQLLEFGNPLGIKKVDTGRQDLAELDKGRAHFLKSAPDILGGRRGLWRRPGDPGIGVGRLQDRLLMAGALAEHGIEPEADKERNEREDDDDGQGLVLMMCGGQHNALNAWIQRALHAPSGIAPLLCDC